MLLHMWGFCWYWNILISTLIYIFFWDASPSKTLLSNTSKMFPRNNIISWETWLSYLNVAASTCLLLTVWIKVQSLWCCLLLPVHDYQMLLPMAVWVRYSHLYLHLCRPGGSTAVRLTYVRNPLVTVVLIREEMQCRELCWRSSRPSARRLERPSCMTSDTPVHAFRSAWKTSGVCQRDRLCLQAYEM